MNWDSYDQLMAESRPERPFNSGTERDEWQIRNCTTCVYDREQRAAGDGFGPGCPLLTLVLVEERTPAQWIESDTDRHRCIEYRHEDDGDGPEPRPVPDPPGQMVLASREEFEGVRLFADVAEHGVTTSARGEVS